MSSNEIHNCTRYAIVHRVQLCTRNPYHNLQNRIFSNNIYLYISKWNAPFFNQRIRIAVPLFIFRTKTTTLDLSFKVNELIVIGMQQTKRNVVRPVDKRQQHALESRQKREEKAILQGFLVYLINQHSVVEFKKPRKKARLTHQLFSIKTLTFQNEKLDIGEFVKSCCKVDYNKDIIEGLDQKKAFRKYLNKKTYFMSCLLMDICLELGYFFECKRVAKGKRNYKTEQIERVWKDGVYLCGKKEVINIGIGMSEHLFEVSKDTANNCFLRRGELKF
ncbi:hypothetical protein EIN_059650 [Entamoeba invadens IP1]|uniref:hypothetical protein n=1 Tax=Entamoeba invadens IP1 TaxID=370355 RepID=UPI0002C3DB1E|nr:hypothetical protein EIN_059650 [Entamoeba invadens IP1]ELP93470.1 hypothetical protein EIN_059650 [Entamoeba invadens IP1]|eukprot:XP_004260241.1 hypothetical protein EIN_059650 [Entamoeba invadens IP1]